MSIYLSRIPNLLTMLRVVLTCWVNYHILNYFTDLLLPAVIVPVIILTDYLDGKIARAYGYASVFGEVFDVCADLFYILSFSIVLSVLNVLPFWFVFIILFKFIEFVITSYFLRRNKTEKRLFVFDFIGKLSVALFYICPLLIYVAYCLSQPLYNFIADVMLFIITLLAAVSSSHRIFSCIKALKAYFVENTYAFRKVVN
ncbi:MAG: CDP-alcohol phosphatidyltransferase family protein [Clostridia bacterium]|nr:CDP-alcohol phosphatidyltransferase family protein [Clostridia bacterium]